MSKTPRKEVSKAPFPFVRQFTAPPFFVDIEDTKRKSKLLLDAVQHVAPQEPKPAGAKKRKGRAKPKLKTGAASTVKKRRTGKR